MADSHRKPVPAVVAAILADPGGFSFFQVVRLLEQQYGGSPVGGVHPVNEAVWLRPAAELVFPLASVQSVASIERPKGTDRFAVTVTFLGLYGTTSPLATSLTEEILFHDGERDGARDLFDLLSHRVLTLFYRAWRKYRYDVCWRAGGADELSARIFALCGLAEPVVREAVGVPAVPLLRYAGLLAHSPRSAAALRGILLDHFTGIPCRIEQNVQRWVWLDEGDHWRLGRQNGRLGSTSTVGLRIADRGGKFRVVFGPVDFETYETLLPTGHRFAEAAALTRLVARDSLGFDLEAQLRHEEIPPLVLARERPQSLGWTSWLGRHAGDAAVVFRVPERAMAETARGAAS